MFGRRRLLAAAVVALSTICLFTVSPSSASASTSTTDVVFVHGYGGCTDVDKAGLSVLLTQYYWHHALTTTYHSVEYYGCDTDGQSIVEYGPDAAGYYPSPDSDEHATDLRHFSYELAWWLWDNFTSQGKPVDLVGHSMGGLIITYALQRVAARDPLFPAYLTVPSVVTFSSPFDGVAGLTCPAGNVQCDNMLPGSDVVDSLQAGGAAHPGAAGTKATFWLIIGSTGCDQVSPSSSLALSGANWAIDYTSPCYTHTSYVTDYSTTADATGTVNGKAFTNGYHALSMMSWALL